MRLKPLSILDRFPVFRILVTMALGALMGYAVSTLLQGLYRTK